MLKRKYCHYYKACKLTVKSTQVILVKKSKNGKSSNQG